MIRPGKDDLDPHHVRHDDATYGQGVLRVRAVDMLADKTTRYSYDEIRRPPDRRIVNGMGPTVGLAVLSESGWFGRSPPLGAWFALAALVMMIAAYALVRRRRASRPDATSPSAIADRLRQVWVIVALVGPGMAVLSGADLATIAWWWVAGQAFSTVLLASAGVLVLVVMHAREALLVAPQERARTWSVFCAVLLSTLCIPLVFLGISAVTPWDVRTSFTLAMCAAYAVAVMAGAASHNRAPLSESNAPLGAGANEWR